MSEINDGIHNGPLEWALNVVGDRWSLRTLHEINQGMRRFNEIQRRTGIPRDRLALRLRRLETWKVIARERYCDHPPRYEYFLTEAGQTLMPTLAALEDWGERYAHGPRAQDPSPRL